MSHLDPCQPLQKGPTSARAAHPDRPDKHLRFILSQPDPSCPNHFVSLPYKTDYTYTFERQTVAHAPAMDDTRRHPWHPGFCGVRDTLCCLAAMSVVIVLLLLIVPSNPSQSASCNLTYATLTPWEKNHTKRSFDITDDWLVQRDTPRHHYEQNMWWHYAKFKAREANQTDWHAGGLTFCRIQGHIDADIFAKGNCSFDDVFMLCGPCIKGLLHSMLKADVGQYVLIPEVPSFDIFPSPDWIPPCWDCYIDDVV